jgi:hypothetical protein
MKKGRPGFLLGVLAERPAASSLADLMLTRTTTSGVRMSTAERLKLKRESLEVDTRYGRVRVKVFILDAGPRFMPEYEDCLRVSRAEDVSIERVIEDARHAGKKKWEDTH